MMMKKNAHWNDTWVLSTWHDAQYIYYSKSRHNHWLGLYMYDNIILCYALILRWRISNLHQYLCTIGIGIRVQTWQHYYIGCNSFSRAYTSNIWYKRVISDHYMMSDDNIIFYIGKIIIIYLIKDYNRLLFTSTKTVVFPARNDHHGVMSVPWRYKLTNVFFSHGNQHIL